MAGANLPITANVGAAKRELDSLRRSLEGIKKSIGSLSQTLAANNRQMTANNAAIQRASDRLSHYSRQSHQAASASNNLNRGVNQLRSSMGALAGVVSARSAGTLADDWTRAENRLGAADVAINQVGNRLEQLRDIAISTRSDFNATVMLFARMKMAGENLAATEADIARAVDITNKALAAGGASGGERMSALIQLSQGLGSGVLQGDELRAIRENSIPLARAIADEFGVTIGELKKLGEEGELTSERVFQAILNAGDAVDAQFARTSATMSDQLTMFTTKLTEYLGAVDDSVGVTEKFGAVMQLIGDNLDTIGSVVLLAATVAMGRFTASIALSAAASVGQTAALIAKTAAIYNVSRAAAAGAVSMRALSTAMAFMGGPIGIAIAAVTTGVVAFANGARDARQTTEDYNEAVANSERILREAAEAAEEARGANAGLSDEQQTAVGTTGQLCSVTDELTESRWRLVDATAQARREEIALQIAQNQKTIDQIENPSLSQRAYNFVLGGVAPTERSRQRREQQARVEYLRDLNSSLRSEQIHQWASGENELRYDPTAGRGSSGGGSSRSGSNRMSDAERAARRYEQALQDLRNEQNELQLSERDLFAVRELANAGLERNINATDELSRAIIDNARKLYDMRQRADDMAASLEMRARATEDARDAELDLLAVTDPGNAARQREEEAIERAYQARIKDIGAMSLEADRRRELLNLAKQTRDNEQAAASGRRENDYNDARLEFQRQGQDISLDSLALYDREEAEYQRSILEISRSRDDALRDVAERFGNASEEYAQLSQIIISNSEREIQNLAARTQMERTVSLINDIRDGVKTMWSGGKEAMLSYFADLALQFAQAAVMAKSFGTSMSQAFSNFGGGGASGGLLGSILGSLGGGGKGGKGYGIGGVGGGAIPGMGGGIGGFFTSLLGPIFGREYGGSIKAGVPTWVGEKGRELITSSNDAYVVPNHRLGGGVNNFSLGNTNIHINNAQGLSAQDIALHVTTQQERAMKQLARQVFREGGR